MERCFLIGIGGTGAKCVEAIIHLAAAGLGPDDCTVMLVDQDAPNGNGARSQQVLESYSRLRGALAQPGGGAVPVGNGLFHTAFATPSPGIRWSPTAQNNASLRDICNYGQLAAPHRALLDCLYVEQEQEQSLNEGFRARPSVGAAVLLAQTIESDVFWEAVLESIDDARRGDSVKIFLVGSIFGGTGAAGMPTFARLIRQSFPEGAGNHVAIGGTLMLPYFYFPAPPRQGAELLPDSSAFLEQTQGALEYYDRLFSETRLFDSLYAIGWSPLLEVGDYMPGGREQRNPALIPELFAGISALRFFKTGSAAPVSYFGGRTPVGWGDLPQIHPHDSDEVRRSFGALIRFAHAYHNVYRSHLSAAEWRLVRHETWFRRLIGSEGAVLAQPDAQVQLDRLDAYCQEVLRWTANLVYGGAGMGDDVRLCQVNQFARKTNHAFERAELSAPPGYQRMFGRLVEGEQGPDLPEIFHRLTYNRFGGGNPGPVTFAKALHQACAFRPQ